MKKTLMDYHDDFISWPAFVFDNTGWPKIVRFTLSLTLGMVWFVIAMIPWILTAPFVMLWELWEMTD